MGVVSSGCVVVVENDGQRVCIVSAGGCVVSAGGGGGRGAGGCVVSVGGGGGCVVSAGGGGGCVVSAGGGGGGGHFLIFSIKPQASFVHGSGSCNTLPLLYFGLVPCIVRVRFIQAPLILSLTITGWNSAVPNIFSNSADISFRSLLSFIIFLILSVLGVNFV